MSKEPEPYLADFEEFYGAYPRRDHRVPALRKYQALRRKGVSAETLLRAARNYAALCSRKGTARDFILMAKTFLGPSRLWEEYLEAKAEETPPDTAKARACFNRGGCRPSWAQNKGIATCRWCMTWLWKIKPPEEKA